MPSNRDPALVLSNVSKAFGPVVALRSASLTAYPGSIHALVGENGAGKSTLVKIVAGVYRRDSGEFLLHGREVDFSSTAESKHGGVAVIYQEPTLFPDLSVTENIFMGRQPVGRGPAASTVPPCMPRPRRSSIDSVSGSTRVDWLLGSRSLISR